MYTRGQAVEFIEKIFGKGALTNQGQNISVVCPICLSGKSPDYSKRKLAIRTDNLLVHCWVCGYKARNLANLIKRFHPGFLGEYIEVFGDIRKGIFDDNKPQEPLGPKVNLPPDFELLAEVKPVANLAWGNAIRYLTTRLNDSNLDDACWYWRFGTSEMDTALRERIIIPSFDAEGNLNYYSARALSDKIYPKYLNPTVPREDVIFNEINIRWDEPLTIVEGPFDLIKCNTNATCLLGSELTTDYKLFLMLVKHQTPVILALDPDVKQKTIEIAQLLHEYGLSVSILDIPDKYKDVGEMPRDDFISHLNHARMFDSNLSLREKINGLIK